MEPALFKLFFLIAFAFFIFGEILIACWIYKDSKANRQNSWLWASLFLLSNFMLLGIGSFIVLSIYAIVRQQVVNKTQCLSCGAKTPITSKYCINCGTQQKQLSDNFIYEKPSPKLLYIGVGIIAVIFVIFTGIILYKYCP